MTNLIWLAPAIAGVAYLYFKYENRKWEVSISSFWNRELERIDERDVHGFMTYNPPILSEENAIKLAIINTVRDVLIEMEKKTTYFITKTGYRGSYVYISYNGMEFKFSEDTKNLSSFSSEMIFYQSGEDLDYVNDLLSDRDKKTIEKYLNYIANE